MARPERRLNDLSMEPMKLALALLALLPAACATAEPVRIPSGDRGFAIQCGPRKEDCFDEARRQCPNNEYVILGMRDGPAVVSLTSAGPEPYSEDRHELIVDCRRPRR